MKTIDWFGNSTAPDIEISEYPVDHHDVPEHLRVAVVRLNELAAAFPESVDAMFTLDVPCPATPVPESGLDHVRLRPDATHGFVLTPLGLLGTAMNTVQFFLFARRYTTGQPMTFGVAKRG